MPAAFGTRGGPPWFLSYLHLAIFRLLFDLQIAPGAGSTVEVLRFCTMEAQLLRTNPPLQLHHPTLSPTADLALAESSLKRYTPASEQQEAARDQMLRFIAEHPETAHRRDSLSGHLTASALVVERETGRVLLTHHRKLGRWLQLGGHCDGDANLAGVALREAVEESGIADLTVVPKIVDVDIHPIPARPGEPAHLHLDSRFLVLARRAESPVCNHESNELRWLRPQDVRSLTVDDSVLRLLDLLKLLNI